MTGVQTCALPILDTREAAADWAACAHQTLPFFEAPSAEHALWRLSLPPTTPVLALPSQPLVEWHGGLRWVWAPAHQATALRELTHGCGGHATLWRASQAHGIEDFQVGFQSPLSAPLKAISDRLQAEFDPHSVFCSARLMGPHAPTRA